MAVNDQNDAFGPADRRIAALYREVASDEAPSHLDARLMAAAREGLASRPAAVRKPWWNAWRLPFAFAAVGVVCASLVPFVLEEGGGRLTAPPQAVQDLRDYSPPARVAEGSPDASPTAPEADAALRSRSSVRKERAPAAEAPAIARGAASGSAPESGPSAQNSERRADAQAASQDALRSFEKAPAEVSASTQAAPAAAAPKPEAALRRQEMGALAAKARPSPEVERLIAELEGRAPQIWIDRIASLRRDGRAAEADALLTEFRRRFPAEAGPDTLR